MHKGAFMVAVNRGSGGLFISAIRAFRFFCRFVPNEGLVFGVVVDISARESAEDKMTCNWTSSQQKRENNTKI